MPRFMNFNRTFRRFQWGNIQVEDTVGRYENGEWIEIMPLSAPRIIRAIPLTAGSQDIAITPEGSASTTDLFLVTDAILYYTDINAVAQEVRQSYVLYKDFKYRVLGEALLRGNVDTLTIYRSQRFIQ